YRVDLYMTDKEGKNHFLKSTETANGMYFFSLERDFDYYISVKDFNNKEKKLAFTTNGIIHSDTLHLDPIIINTLSTRSFVVENIYYDFAKYNLREESKTVIDTTILKILNAYPRIIVEISSHTDSVGTDQSNMTLSQNRAQSVVNYLIQKGISKDRLVAKGYGESKPIAPNSNPDGSDNPEGRQKNRRTEFRVIGHLDDDADILYEYD
ncbi:MAG: OmpA family protein, partial [Bacteroidales bacterium]|nr:OmpA family protein [Bacteroidales bacterium]